jgi:hypothetical protein
MILDGMLTPKPKRGISKPLGSLMVEVMVVAILDTNRIWCGESVGVEEESWNAKLEMFKLEEGRIS